MDSRGLLACFSAVSSLIFVRGRGRRGLPHHRFPPEYFCLYAARLLWLGRPLVCWLRVGPLLLILEEKLSSCVSCGLVVGSLYCVPSVCNLVSICIMKGCVLSDAFSASVGMMVSFSEGGVSVTDLRMLNHPCVLPTWSW